MKLKFGEQLIEPTVRRLHALHDVAFDSAWFEEAADRDAYYMHRDLALTPVDRETITRHQLRYDITISPCSRRGSSSLRRTGTITRRAP
jgi:glucose-6-phosphate isomerase